MICYTQTVSELHGNSITLIDPEGQDHIPRTWCSCWASTSSGELCYLVTALVKDLFSYNSTKEIIGEVIIVF